MDKSEILQAIRELPVDERRLLARRVLAESAGELRPVGAPRVVWPVFPGRLEEGALENAFDHRVHRQQWLDDLTERVLSADSD